MLLNNKYSYFKIKLNVMILVLLNAFESQVKYFISYIKMSTIAKSILRLFVPNRNNLSLYKQYLCTAEKIALYQNGPEIKQIRTIILILSICVVHLVYLSTASITSLVEAIAHGDVYYVLQSGDIQENRPLNLITALCLSTGIIFYQRFFLRVDLKLVEHYWHLLFHQHKYHWLLPVYQNRPVTEVIRNFAWFLQTLLLKLFSFCIGNFHYYSEHLG